MPTTTAVERIFSTAGFVISSRRTSLSDEMFEFLLFNHLNSDLRTFGAIVDELVNGRKRYFIADYYWENIVQYWDGIGLETTYWVLGRKLGKKFRHWVLGLVLRKSVLGHTGCYESLHVFSQSGT